MASLNKVMLIGNLTRDPQLRYIPNGTAVADFGIAINRDYTDKDGGTRTETCFVDVVVWRKQAEFCSKFLTKGSLVFVEGSLRLENWETPQGEKRSKHRVVAYRVQLLDWRQKEPRTPSSEEHEMAAPPEAQSGPPEGYEEIPF